jgi:DNA-binding transcriptional LysR family regulator
VTKFLTMQISNWIKEGSVDFGFVNSVSELNTIPLQEDEMVAVMPVNHPFSIIHSSLLGGIAKRSLNSVG